MKRDYSRREDIPPPRSRVAVDYGSRVASERRPSYRDYPARGPGPGYSELPRSTSRAAPRRGYVDDGYSQRFERPPPPPPPHLSYREGRPRDYETLSGSKRAYSAIVSFISVYNCSFCNWMLFSNCWMKSSLITFVFLIRMMFLPDMLILVLANQELD